MNAAELDKLTRSASSDEYAARWADAIAQYQRETAKVRAEWPGEPVCIDAGKSDIGCDFVVGTTAGLGQTYVDFLRWERRLAYYAEQVASKPEQIHATVYRPMVLGQYGDGSGGMLPIVGGFGELTHPEWPKVADAGTLARVAEQIDVALEWERKRVELLADDLVTGGKKVLKGVADATSTGAGVGVAIAVVLAMVLVVRR